MYLWVHSSAGAARLSRTGPGSLVSPASRLARIQRWKFRHTSLCRCHQMRRLRCLRPRKMSLQREPREKSTDLRESTLSADTPLAGCWTRGRLSDRRQTWFETSLPDPPPCRDFGDYSPWLGFWRTPRYSIHLAFVEYSVA